MVELKGLSAIRNRGQASVSLMSDVDGHKFWFLAGLNSIYPLQK